MTFACRNYRIRTGIFGRHAALVFLTCFFANAAFAQLDSTVSAAAAQNAALTGVERAARNGPVSIDLAGQAKLALPAGYIYVPQPEAGRYLRAFGGAGHEYLAGVLLSTAPGPTTVVLLEVNAAGHINDADARSWSTDSLLKILQENVEAENPERVAHGVAPKEMLGWVEPPNYDATAHRLMIATSMRDKGNVNDKGMITFSSCSLGRDGFLCLNVVSKPDQASVMIAKSRAKELLAATAFLGGKAYADFNATTDRAADFGLAAVVGGFAAKKLDVLTAGAAFVLKAWKLALGGLLAATLIGRKAFGFLLRRKRPAEA